MASIRLGARGSLVRELQEDLNILGANIKADGVFGSLTQAAVISFQKKYSLTSDGIVGPITSRKLEEAVRAETDFEDEEEHEDRPDIESPGQGHLWCPFAVRLSKDMTTRGYYQKGYPEGAIVHFTAGRCDTEDDMISSMDWGRSSGYAFFGIGPKGVIYQAHPLNRWGYHAGSSSYQGLGSSVSQYAVGIEVASAGRLDAGNRSWFGRVYEAARVRTVGRRDNMIAGSYVKYTEAQEKSLEALLLWLKLNKPDVFEIKFILGHDEVSPGRKNDPGGALSMTMPELRKRIEEIFKARS